MPSPIIPHNPRFYDSDLFVFTEKDRDSFWSNVIKTFLEDGTEHCWLWQGAINKFGYGEHPNSSNTGLAHRFAVQLFGRVIPPKLIVNHKCRIRSCVNPKHLNIMTQSENIKLVGREQSLNDPDLYEEQRPLTNLQYDIREIERRFSMVYHNWYRDMGLDFKYLQSNYQRENIRRMLQIIKDENITKDNYGIHQAAKFPPFNYLPTPKHLPLEIPLSRLCRCPFGQETEVRPGYKLKYLQGLLLTLEEDNLTPQDVFEYYDNNSHFKPEGWDDEQ